MTDHMPGPTNCPDCGRYYREHRGRLKALWRDDRDVLVEFGPWLDGWFDRYHHAGHVDPVAVDVAKVREAAGVVYFPVGVDVFLTGRNRAFNHRTPLDLIESGETATVLAWLASAAEGSAT